jgi:MFS family permease
MSMRQTAAERAHGGMPFKTLLALIIAGEFASALSGSMLYNALGKLFAIYGDPVHVGWLFTSFALASAGSAVLISRLGDLYGRARMFKLMLLTLLIGSTISALATDLDVIIVGRAIQGLAVAILPLGFGLLREHVHDSRDLNLGVGLLGGTYSLSTGIGFIISGFVIDNLGWQHIFTVGAIAAALALVLTVWLLPESAQSARTGKIDFVGALVVIPIVALLLTFNIAKAHGWSDPRTVGLIVFATAVLAAWAVYELRHPDPLVDLRLLANPTIAMVNGAIFFMSMGPVTYTQVVMPLIQQPVWTGVGFGISATIAGLVKLPTNLTSGLAAFAAGLLARRYSMRPAVILATVANFLAFVTLTLYHGSLVFVLAVCILLISPAATIMFACAPGMIMQSAPPERTSEVTGLSSVMRALAQAIGAQMISVTLASSAATNATGTSYPDAHAYMMTFAFLAAVSLLSMAIALFIPRQPMLEARTGDASAAAHEHA